MAKKVTKKICKTCKDDIIKNQDNNAYVKKNTYHQLNAKDYCKDHNSKYHSHKCKPVWCDECGFLEKYEIIISEKV